jgi:hypothetical protein
MKNAHWFLFAAVAVPTFVACGDDDSADGMFDASGGGGAGGISSDSGTGASGGGGAGGSGGSAGRGGSAGAPSDAGPRNDSGGTSDSGRGGSSGSAGTGGTGGSAGRSNDAASDITIVGDASADGAGGGRPDAGSGHDAPNADGGAACSSGPAMGLSCTHYCSAWFSACQPIATWSTTYASPAACASACAQWDDAKLCCRAEHAHNATTAPNANQAEKHCGHAAGVDAPNACL